LQADVRHKVIDYAWDVSRRQLILAKLGKSKAILNLITRDTRFLSDQRENLFSLSLIFFRSSCVSWTRSVSSWMFT